MVKLDWTMAFDGPMLSKRQVASHVYVDPGYEGYHTTSDSSIGNELIVKQRAGGSACPFSRADPDVVYQLDVQATLDYYKPDNTKGAVKYAVVAKTTPYKTFFLFDTLESAQKYVDTGSTAHCLKYTAAGDTVSPDNPAWTPAAASLDVALARIAELEEKLAGLSIPS